MNWAYYITLYLYFLEHIGAIGDILTETTMVLAKLFDLARVPVISYGALDPSLSQFPLFMRTLADAHERAEVHIQL